MRRSQRKIDEATQRVESDRRIRELAAIHAARKKLSLPEEEYRSYLQAWTGESSAAKLNTTQRQKVIENFREMGFERTNRAHVAKSDTGQVAKVKALWLKLHEMGAVTDASEAALNKYVRRMTKIDHVNWLDTKKANVVIESLKKWTARLKKADAQG